MLEKIEDNLKEAYENLGWEERKILLDNLNNAFDKGEISPEEFEKSAMYLKKSCPDGDANNWTIYWLDDIVKFTKILMNQFAKERIRRCFYQCLLIEGYLKSVLCFEGVQDKNGNGLKLGDTFFNSIEDYEKRKEEMCKYLRYYGLTPEQEGEIMQNISLTQRIDLIFTLLKSNEPKF